MRKLLPLLLLVLSFSAGARNGAEILTGQAARAVIPEAEMIRYKTLSDVPAFIRFYQHEQISFESWEKWMTDHFFKGQDKIGFRLVGTEEDALGMVHYRFQQMWNGYPLEHAKWIIHTENGMVTSMNGNLFDRMPDDAPGLSEAAALALALENVGAEEYMWEVEAEEKALQLLEKDPTATYYPKGELVIVGDDPTLTNINLHLAWKFNIYAHQPMSRHEIYVDANAGNVILENDLIHHADSVGTAVTNYNGTFSIVADFTGSEFRLRESGRGNGVSTYNLNSGTTGLGSDFTDSDNLWNSAQANEMSGPDAHYGTEMTYDFYFDNFGRNSIDDNGFELISRVNYGVNYANAFWNGQFMTYGSGGASFATVDIAGHEVSHGLTTNTADLVYAYEPGALNESFSDIFGAAIEFFAEGFSNGDWLMGEDRGSAIRSLSNPNSYGDPDTYQGNNWFFGAGDNGGVHTNSGVQNFWFYLLTVGGTGTNDIGDSYSVTGLGVEDAQAIAYRNLVVYLSDLSQYEDARFYAIMAAQDLFGACSDEVESTTDAWYAVGIGDPYVPTVVADFEADDTEDCNVPFTANFSNFSMNADTYLWNFGDGNTSTAALPSHTYSAAGTYTVSLQASSSCGSDSKSEVSYIEVGPNVPCDYILPIAGEGVTQQGCNGYLYDNGGPDGNYQANTDSWVTIAPCGANTVTLTFESFQLESGFNCPYDSLVIYDGSGLNSPVIGVYCGSNSPPTTVTSTGPSITVRLSADGGLEYSGFKASWECEEGNTPPVPEFSAAIDETCDGLVSFTNESYNCPDGYLWRFGDGNTSTDQNPSHEYTSNGTYNVTLVVSNGNGADSLIKQSYITIDRPTSPAGPNVDICPGESTVLYAMPTTAGENRWYDNPNSSVPIHVGDSFTTPILTASTPYYVETVVAGTSGSVGPTDNTFGGGAMFNFNQYLVFDVYASSILKSVRVYAEGAGTRVIEMRNSTGTPIQTATVNLPDGESVVTLNFNLTPGSDYQLGIATGSNIGLFRNNENVSYPYVLNGFVSINRSSANENFGLNHYYFFYDWEVGEPDCISPKHQIFASTAVCTGVDELDGSLISIYPNPTMGEVTMRWDGVEVERITVYNAQGQLVEVVNPMQRTTLERSFESGVYLIHFTTANATSVKRVVVQ